jgi:hypothetical protein
MDTMKRALIFSAILLLGASAAFAERVSPTRFSNRLFNDVVEMTRAGLSDATIVAYVKARRSRLDSDVNADDLIRLRRAGVSEAVVGTIAGITGLDGGPSGQGHDSEAIYDSREETAVPVEPSYSEDEAYSYPYGYPYWYAYGYPYWYGYGPYFSTTFFFGGRSFHGRGFDHRGFGHGGGRGGSGGHGGHGRH